METENNNHGADAGDGGKKERKGGKIDFDSPDFWDKIERELDFEDRGKADESVDNDRPRRERGDDRGGYRRDFNNRRDDRPERPWGERRGFHNDSREGDRGGYRRDFRDGGRDDRFGRGRDNDFRGNRYGDRDERPRRFDSRDGGDFRRDDRPRRFDDRDQRPPRREYPADDRGGYRNERNERFGQEGERGGYRRDFRDGGRDDRFSRGRDNDFRGNRYGDRDERPRRFDSRDGGDFRRDDRPRRFEDRDNRFERRDERFGRDERRGYRNESGNEVMSDRRGGDDRGGYRERRAESAGRTFGGDNPDAPKPIRLNRYIANSGVCSRRDADDLILAGEISVNGEVVRELGCKVSYRDQVVYKGKQLNPQKKVYILLNKPKDTVTTADDPEGRRTVYDLIADATRERVYSVGRLDRNTTGLLLFTNNGDMAAALTHPSSQVEKLYHVVLDRNVDIEDLEKLADGIELEDGMIAADEVSYANDTRNEVGISIHSGRNRIVRRMFEHLGYEVVRLDRVMFAGLTKKNLGRGEWRMLTANEVTQLLTLVSESARRTAPDALAAKRPRIAKPRTENADATAENDIENDIENDGLGQATAPFDTPATESGKTRSDIDPDNDGDEEGFEEELEFDEEGFDGEIEGEIDEEDEEMEEGYDEEADDDRDEE